MKVIVAGTRNFGDPIVVFMAIDSSPWKHQITEVVSGCAQGVDQFGEDYARLKGIKVVRFPADWNKHGKAAGPIRNKQMALYADALVAVWAGRSRGTKNMIDEMERIGKPVHVYMEWL
ncbi:hypothetical protein LCGC14_1951150 [marine sediment metagenome]|uniref:YspA cpYpsA-related SLOG domain-containing protein n=1 Tax=marine sediment metagenome TaxID=412755 RepID=A0A0F9FHS7_9ZZZZ